MWPASSKRTKRLPGIASWAAIAVRDGDDRVVLAPHDQRRQPVGEREPVAGADALPAGLDHRAQRVQEGLARAGVVELREAAREHADVAARPQPDLREQAAEVAPQPDQSLRGQRGQDVVGARQRGGAQQQVDVAPEPAAGDQHEAVGALGELVGVLHRDAAAQRVPDHRDALVAEGGDDVARAAGVRAERVVAARCRGLAVAEQVGGDHGVVLAEQGRDARPGVGRVGDPVEEQQRRARCRRSGSSPAARGAPAPGARRSSRPTQAGASRVIGIAGLTPTDGGCGWGRPGGATRRSLVARGDPGHTQGE